MWVMLDALSAWHTGGAFDNKKKYIREETRSKLYFSTVAVHGGDSIEIDNADTFWVFRELIGGFCCGASSFSAYMSWLLCWLTFHSKSDEREKTINLTSKDDWWLLIRHIQPKQFTAKVSNRDLNLPEQGHWILFYCVRQSILCMYS